jgi:hypothetical protein
LCGDSTKGLIGTHLIPACVDNGISVVPGAGFLAAIQLHRHHRIGLAQRPL